MNRPALSFALAAWLFFSSATIRALGETAAPIPKFAYDLAKQHELKPHRRTIPTEGAHSGFNQLHLTLTVSSAGDVITAEASNDKTSAEFWPKVRDEVYGWKYAPFESNGHATAAEIEEYVDLVPPERLPRTHVPPPPLHTNSAIAITLSRSGCFGTCPSYSVTLSNSGIVFEGGGFVVATGRHTAAIDQDALQSLAHKFLKADFYSMEDKYIAGVTDNPTYTLSISIDGKSKRLEDYVGSWEGMPAIVTELEEDVDDLAQTDRWITGSTALVAALQAEHYNFKTYDAQILLKEAAQRGQADTVQDLLETGVPLNPLPAPKPKPHEQRAAFEEVGWLTSASADPKTLQLLIDAQLSHDNQADKDLALVNAARAGKLESVRALIAYGANPNADLSRLIITQRGAGYTMQGPGSGSVLIYAAGSGNPDVLREILQYHPSLNARDRRGRTALFAVSESAYDEGDSLAECIRILVQAGADVNARDNDGNTPLHETYVTEVEEELLRLGADVNARNKDGETPIFTTIDNSAIALYAEHGADLTVRNNKGQTALESVTFLGPSRVQALKDAIALHNQGANQPGTSEQNKK